MSSKRGELLELRPGEKIEIPNEVFHSVVVPWAWRVLRRVKQEQANKGGDVETG